MICSRCKSDRDLTAFYPNADDTSWCVRCINNLRNKRPGVKREKAVKAKRTQRAITTLLSDFQQSGEEFIYLLRCQTQYKIGFSDNVKRRVETFNTASPWPHQIVAVVPGGRQQEQEIHSKFRRLRIFGEWFKRDKTILEYFEKLPNSMIFLEGYVKQEAPAPSSVLDSKPENVDQSLPRLVKKGRVINSEDCPAASHQSTDSIT